MLARHPKAARTLFLAVALPLTVAGCVTTEGEGLAHAGMAGAARYAEMPSEKFNVEAVDLSAIDPRFLRQVVDYRTTESPGTIVVDPHNRFLYLIEKGSKAVR